MERVHNEYAQQSNVGRVHFRVLMVSRQRLEYSYTGRRAYLEAIQSIWEPKPLESLVGATKAIQRWLKSEGLFQEFPEDQDGQIATDLSWAKFRSKRCPEARTASEKLRQWRNAYRSRLSERDIWIMDAALQTVAFAALREAGYPREWIYFPTEATSLKFKPSLPRARWLGNDFESWSAFAHRMRQFFGRQLTRYRLRVRAMSFRIEEAENESRDASWLATYINGKSWDQMAAVDVLQNCLEPKSLVRNSAVRFARRIGVTLPKRPAGRRPSAKEP